MSTPVSNISSSFQLNFYVTEPVVTMREKPSQDSTVSSQAYFGEQIFLNKEDSHWTQITTSDGYSGWVNAHPYLRPWAILCAPYLTSVKISRLSAHIYHVKDTEYGPIKTLPYGSRLQVLDHSDTRWLTILLPNQKECFIQKGDVAPEPTITDKSALVKFSEKFLGLPYTWGGRSSFGYDCSGFVQMLYSQMGVQLPRDSSQQVLDKNFQNIVIDQLEAGDLIFFGNKEKKISHVGMSLGNGEFIHSTSAENQPWIRISKLSDSAWNGQENAQKPYRVACQLIKNSN